MPSKSNVEMLDKVSASLEAAGGVFVVDYRGLSVKETQEVRRALRAAGAEMKVYKNNIVKIALENAGLPARRHLRLRVLRQRPRRRRQGHQGAVREAQEDELRRRHRRRQGPHGRRGQGLRRPAQPRAAHGSDRWSFARDIAVCVSEVPGGLARSINAVAEQKQAA